MSKDMVSINDEYHWGLYCELKVIIMTKNDYINATRLCIDNGKRFDNWLRNQSSKQLISAILKEENVSEELILIKNMKGPNEYRGTYVHRKLMFSIVSWTSARNAIMMSEVLSKALSSDPNNSEMEQLIKLLSTISIKKTDSDEKYIKVKRNSENHESKNYTLDKIIDMVKPVIVLKDLTGALSDIRRTLRTNIDKCCGIYMFYNKETNEYYIGSSKNVISRISDYLTDSYITKPTKYKNLIKEAMIKYTKASFSLLILELLDEYTQVSKREMYYIELLDPKYNVDLYKLK
jgi:hypothetical protein